MNGSAHNWSMVFCWLGEKNHIGYCPSGSVHPYKPKAPNGGKLRSPLKSCKPLSAKIHLIHQISACNRQGGLIQGASTLLWELPWDSCSTFVGNVFSGGPEFLALLLVTDTWTRKASMCDSEFMCKNCSAASDRPAIYSHLGYFWRISVFPNA